MITLDQMQQMRALLGRDVLAFLPELVLCGTIVLLLLLRLFRSLDRLHLGWVALAGCVLGLVISWLQWNQQPPFDPRAAEATPSLPLFTGLLVYDNFTIFLRLFLLFFVALIIGLSLLTGIPDREDSADFYSLLLGATVGMALMASSNHLLMVFIGVEMASLPSYALAGFLKGRRQASEAALKYVVYGGGASGIMLYGISLLAGKFGTASLPVLAGKYLTALHPAGDAILAVDPVLILGTLFLLIGIGFKLAVVPFHFWCPDVFEGASAEVAGFLSVASKGAALALLGRVVLVLGGLDTNSLAARADGMMLARYLVPALALFAAVTATFGNLAAYLQTNLKRLLAYSTIAHAGYMVMGLAPLTRDGAGAVLFYLIAYLFMNLGAFAVVAFLRNQTGSEDLSSFRGLVRRAPVMVVTLSVFLLSLLGIPPLAGFAAKFQIFRVLYDGGQLYGNLNEPGLSYTLYALLAIGGLNTVLSVFYYLKVIKVMILETSLEEAEGKPCVPLPAPTGPVLYASVLAVAILLVGILWNPLADVSTRGVERFRQAPRAVASGEYRICLHSPLATRHSPLATRHSLLPRGGVAVISSQDAAVLERILRREGRSLLQYLSEAFPWTRTGTGENLANLQQVICEERDAIAALGRFLLRNERIVPYLGPFPMAFFSMNFVSLDFLLPRLVEYQRQALAALEHDRANLNDAAAVAAVDQFLALKQQHLQVLDRLVGAASATSPCA
jgi:NADH-quinone oxidoreductase subunit N